MYPCVCNQTNEVRRGSMGEMDCWLSVWLDPRTGWSAVRKLECSPAQLIPRSTLILACVSETSLCVWACVYVWHRSLHLHSHARLLQLLLPITPLQLRAILVSVWSEWKLLVQNCRLDRAAGPLMKRRWASSDWKWIVVGIFFFFFLDCSEFHKLTRSSAGWKNKISG